MYTTTDCYKCILLLTSYKCTPLQTGYKCKPLQTGYKFTPLQTGYKCKPLQTGDKDRAVKTTDPHGPHGPWVGGVHLRVARHVVDAHVGRGGVGGVGSRGGWVHVAHHAVAGRDDGRQGLGQLLLLLPVLGASVLEPHLQHDAVAHRRQTTLLFGGFNNNTQQTAAQTKQNKVP